MSLAKKMEKYLSGTDMIKGTGVPFVLYPDLQKYKDLDDLLGEKGAVVVLYETQKNSGHWTLVFRQGKTVEFFDSYNYKPDGEFKFVPDDFRKINDMVFPQLTKMLYDSGYEIHYNNFKLQSNGRNIATCGRHVITRLRYKDLDINKFYKMLKNISKKTGYNFDEIVTILTNEF
jgi:hypothetical protein